MTRFAWLGFMTLMATALTAQVSERPFPAAGNPVPDQYIVTFRPNANASDRAQAVARSGGSIRFNYRIINAAAVTLPNATARAALASNMAVASITPDRIIETPVTPDGARGNGNGNANGSQIVGEGVRRVGLPPAGVTYSSGVAVLDTGVARVSDLNVATTFFDAYSGTCTDVDGHGTHVAGILGAIDNRTGVLGVAPGTTIYCVKVVNDNGAGTDSAVMQGLEWVALNGASVNPPIRVINMSFGRQMFDGDMTGGFRQAVQAVAAKGIAIVVSAGNDASREVSQFLPAGFPEVVAVASSTADKGQNQCARLGFVVPADTASYFTTDGALVNDIGVTISAPGEARENLTKDCLINSIGIPSLTPSGGTLRVSGTSQAAPHVAGIVVRYIQTGGLAATNTPATVRAKLRSTTPPGNIAPLDSPILSYTFDGEREGIAQAP